MGLQRAPLQTFEGLNTRDAPYDLPAGETPDALNVRFLDNRDNETITPRKGPKNIKSGATTLTSSATNALVTARGDLIVSADDLYFAGATDGVTGFGDYVKKYDNVSGGAQDWSLVNAFGFTWAFPTTNNPGITVPAQKLADNTGTTAVWGGTPPTRGKQAVFWRGRIVLLEEDTSGGAGPFRRIRYSDAGNPESPTGGNWGNNFIDIYDQEDSTNMMLVVHNNNLYLFKESSLWMIYDPNTFANRLICMYGTGKGPQEGFPATQTRTAISCPLDRRLYWYSPQDGRIHSSNGETDHVIETQKFDLPQASIDEFPGQNGQIAYDPVQKSVMFFYSEPGQTWLNAALEIVLRGKPGEHPLLFHRFQQPYESVFTQDYEVDGTISEFYSPDRLMGFPSNNRAKLYDIFNQTGSDDGTAIVSKYMSSWAPFISEEPTERIRRVNFLYRGLLTLTVESAMVPATAGPAGGQVLAPAEFVGTNRADRTFVTLRGPNRKGRYHRFTINGSTLNKDWEISALEFVIRGGKLKK